MEVSTEVEKKHPLTSKTLWVNGLLAVFGFILAFKPDLASYLNEGMVITVIGFVNMILRMVTQNKIGIE